MATEDEILEIKNRLDISTIIGRSIQLKKSGHSYVGLCPFHNEKTPSLHVHPQDGYFKCFGCGVGGDVYKFQELITGANFADVLKNLAEEAGVEIKKQHFNPKQAEKMTRQKQSISLMQSCLVFFKNSLNVSKNGESARQYLLAKRQINKEIWQEFSLGFGGMQDEELLQFLNSESKSIDLAKDLSVLKSGEKGDYSFFKKRIIFPIRSTRGDVIAFGGRIFFESDQRKAKYLNGSQSELYDKSNSLYGLYEALPALKKGVPAVLVEGYFDVIATHRCGMKTGVSPCGTALTHEQLKLIKKYTDEIIICMDNDVAGQKARIKSILMALSHGFKVRECILDFKDPDECIKEKGETALEVALHASLGALENRYSLLKTAVEEKKVSDYLDKATRFWPFLAALPEESLLKSQYIKQVAELLSEDRSIIEKQVKAAEDASLAKVTTKAPKKFDNRTKNKSNKGKINTDQEFAQSEVPQWLDDNDDSGYQEFEDYPFNDPEPSFIPPKKESGNHFSQKSKLQAKGELLSVGEKDLIYSLLAYPLLVDQIACLSSVIEKPELRRFINDLHIAVVNSSKDDLSDVYNHVGMTESLYKEFKGAGNHFRYSADYFTLESSARCVKVWAGIFEEKLSLNREFKDIQKAISNKADISNEEMARLLKEQSRIIREISEHDMKLTDEYLLDSKEELELPTELDDHQVMKYFSDKIHGSIEGNTVIIEGKSKDMDINSNNAAEVEVVDLPWEQESISHKPKEAFFEPEISAEKQSVNTQDLDVYDIEDEFLW